MSQHKDHSDPYLKLGPFKVEVLLKYPFCMIFQDFFTLNELNWMKEYSTQRLSRNRYNSSNNRTTLDLHKPKKYNVTQEPFIKRFSAVSKTKTSTKKIYTIKLMGSHVIKFPVIAKLSDKIENATSMKVSEQFY